MARDYSKWASNRGTWREVLFPETIGRVQYFLRSIALTLLMMIAMIPFSVFTSLAGDGGTDGSDHKRPRESRLA